jgi:hypothetical protein
MSEQATFNLASQKIYRHGHNVYNFPSFDFRNCAPNDRCIALDEDEKSKRQRNLSVGRMKLPLDLSKCG